MKQEFEMQQSEMDDIIAINKNMPPVMKFGDSWSGMDLTERINAYWQTLGEKYGFKYLTVEGSSKGPLFFLAEPKPIVVPKTQSEIEIDKYIGDAMGYLSLNVTEAIRRIIKHIESCDYQCEGGPLSQNIAFIALKKITH